MLTKPPKTGVDLEQGQGSSWLEHSEDFHRCETHPGALKSALINQKLITLISQTPQGGKQL